jgi:ribonuclease P protein component
MTGGQLEAGISASRKTGNAVKRNKIKRKMRAALRKIGDIKGKILIYASSQAAEMAVEEIQRSIYEMFKRAGLA